MDANEIKKMLKNENMIIGSDRVLKLLRDNSMESVWVAKNAPKTQLDDILRYASLNSVSVEVLDLPNDELGIACRKPFNIAAIGLKKAAPVARKRH